MSSGTSGLTNGKTGTKRRRRSIWLVAILVVLAAGGYGVTAALRPSRVVDPSKIATVERGDLARVVVATGKIQPLSKAEIKSKASGIVKKIYVDYGDRVKTGQVLAELDKVQLEAAQRAAKANLQAAEAARNSAMAALDRNKVDAEGPDVPFLKLSMERAEHEFREGVVSKSVVEDAQKNYQMGLNKQASAQAALSGARADIAPAPRPYPRPATRCNTARTHQSARRCRSRRAAAASAYAPSPHVSGPTSPTARPSDSPDAETPQIPSARIDYSKSCNCN